ncbi:hypothetical protein SNOG_13678 [Parastagonospora nodorum SN15]|uniref:Uncharacterized protein n=1 Tax=Phaeosphaeria nodorum (strain SN15 / ATCC MYA-4574 / FGSC 10173) TaxID=321614 RepID=Q0U3I6_PHANO|nr:hypothetical protein SNOG_13678 [Parastagonospora nodorum SN15]EAT79125.1 hypothetical protein SNOG_13678 [Parastagonospora nodorum SN15]
MAVYQSSAVFSFYFRASAGAADICKLSLAVFACAILDVASAALVAITIALAFVFDVTIFEATVPHIAVPQLVVVDHRRVDL